MLHPRTMNVTAMALFGTLAIFIRNIALPSLEIAFWRGLIAIAVLLLLRLVTPQGHLQPLTRRRKLLLLLSGAAVGLNWALLFMAYQHTSVAVATLAYYFAPVLVMVLSPLLFRERVTASQVLCFSGATLGLVLVISGSGSLGSGNLLGIAFGLGAACLYAFVVLLNKACPGGTGLDRAILQMAGSTVLLGIVLTASGGFAILDCDPTSLCNLLIVGVLHTGLAYWLYFTSIRDLSGSQTALLSYIDPMVAILVSALVLQELVTGLQWLGAALILGGTGLYQWLSARKATVS